MGLRKGLGQGTSQSSHEIRKEDGAESRPKGKCPFQDSKEEDWVRNKTVAHSRG
jgi:hypothetical protein